MGLKIEFEKYGDETVYNPQRPTFVLLTRSGKKIGVLPAHNEHVKSCMNSADEVSFTVTRPVETPLSHRTFTSTPTPPYSVGDIYMVGTTASAVVGVAVVGKAIVGKHHTTYVCTNSRESGSYDPSDWIEKPRISNKVWDNLTDFKLLWCKEWNKLFELSVEVEDGDGVIKYVTGTSLGEAELGQVNLYDIYINTTEDIERDDYEPTVLYNPENPNASLLDRIMEKVPHYSIKHVDASIANIQRTFKFSGKSLYDSFQEIAKEIDCIFKIDCYLDSDMKIVREISVYDLLDSCNDCGARGNFKTFCDECNSLNIKNGYGDDTTIFVSVENLTDSVKYSTDTGSVKNCFKLVAGDDLMTAAIRFVNPNGSDYIWHITDDMKADMSDELAAKIDEYNELYDYYRDSYTYSVADVASAYNSIVRKYSVYTQDYSTINPYLVGYSDISESYFNAVDFYHYIKTGLMPTVSMSDTDAQTEAAKLTVGNLSPIAVTNLSALSSATAENAVTGMAKVIVDSRYQLSTKTISFVDNQWTGNFTVVNYSDSEDTATSETITIVISDDYETYLKQKIDKSLNKRMTEEEEINDIVGVFKLGTPEFKSEIKKYSLDMLIGFRDCCQTCLDVLIEQGVADSESWASEENNLYDNMYVPYRNKLFALDAEIQLRESEINTISKMQDLLADGMSYVNDQLDFEKFLGEDLWNEFSAYRREDQYQNSNYITDGLTNAEIISLANDFVKEASKELYKSATLQHSITSTLQNLLVIKEFQPIVDYFETGNWIRIRVDKDIYKLRLLDYEVEFDDLATISVTFSDVLQVSSGISDIESVLSKASSMATSYDATTKQAKQGTDGARTLDGWVNDGLSLTTVKIVNTADDQNITWDEHGLLAREYDDILDSYSDKQLKIINQGLYVTDDNWNTSRAGIGAFTFWNPMTQETEEAYGVIADTIVGNIILGETVGIYNSDATTRIDGDGITVTNGVNTIAINPNAGYIFDVTKSLGESSYIDLDGNVITYEDLSHLMYLDQEGNLNISGNITSSTINCNNIFTVDTNGNVVANSLSSNNANITGGSINILTSRSDDDHIILRYDNGSASYSSCVSSYSLSAHENSSFGAFSANYTSRGVLLTDSSNLKTCGQLAHAVGGGGVLNLYNSDGQGTINLSGVNNTEVFYSYSSGTVSNTVVISGGTGRITCVSLTQTSDENAKNSITELDKQKSSEFIYSLKPVSFRYNDIPLGSHHGITTQDATRQIRSIYGDSDWELVSTPDGDNYEDNHQIYQSLAYTELIADLIATAQSQNERIAKLEAKM